MAVATKNRLRPTLAGFAVGGATIAGVAFMNALGSTAIVTANCGTPHAWATRDLYVYGSLLFAFTAVLSGLTWPNYDSRSLRIIRRIWIALLTCALLAYGAIGGLFRLVMADSDASDPGANGTLMLAWFVVPTVIIGASFFAPRAWKITNARAGMLSALATTVLAAIAFGLTWISYSTSCR